mgnify:FL=1
MKLESSAAPLAIATTMLHMRNVVSLSGIPLHPEPLLFYKWVSSRAHTVDATTGISEVCARAAG